MAASNPKKSSAKPKPKASAKTATSNGKSSKRSQAAQAKKQAQARAEWEKQRRRFIIAIILFIMAIFFIFMYFMPGEKLWLSLHELYCGIFGVFGFMLPLLLLYSSYQNAKDEPKPNYKTKIVQLSITTIFLASTVFCFSVGEDPLRGYADELHNSLIYSSTHSGAGVLGAMMGIPLSKIFGHTGGGFIAIILFIMFLLITFGNFFMKLIKSFKQPVKVIGENISDNKEIRTQVRKKQLEERERKRKLNREEYIKKQVDKKIADKKKKEDQPLRRYKKTPFYEPDKTDDIKQADEGSDKIVKTDIRAEQKIKEKNVTKPKAKPGSDNRKVKKEKQQPVFADDLIFNGMEYDPDELNNIPQDVPDDKADLSVEPFFEPKNNKSNADKNKSEKFELSADNTMISSHYLKPPTNLLDPQPFEEERNISSELNQSGTMLVETLKSFGVSTSIVNISRGPSITRYELQPASGVKISKITNLSDDIAMNLAATGVRIEAPIPGKSAVGIEVPNKHVSIVKMRNLLESKEFHNAKSNLTVALGKDISGKITLADLSRMPHLLIAGSTGSGKSVCINSMLVSLIYKSSPDDVKLMLIDPKVVELGVYNGIPHLLVPVVTDPRKAAGALNWAVNEMLNRYKIFAEYNVRDMHSYNRFVDRQNEDAYSNDIPIDEAERSFEEDEMLAQAQAELKSDGLDSDKPKEPKLLQKMPQIVIVIDELADLMMAAPNEVEESICRLAQMARAAGMHLVIATQRPSVDVITGLIKANVPSRIAFAVKSQIDSRTILDSGGAEKLIGRGDMLFSPIGTTKPIRVQGCFVEDTEIERVIDFIKKNKVVEYDKDVLDEIEKNAVPDKGNKDSDASSSDMDPMIEEAIKCVVEAGQASTSMLQRRFRVGYARAGRLIDEMEQMGIVGPHEGSKPRQVLMTYQQWMERNVSVSEDE